MYPYLRNESEQKEFNELFDIACGLFSKWRSKRQRTAEALVKIGKKAVRPLMYVLHCEYVSNSPDEDYTTLCEEVESILVKIGKDVLPDLEDIATNEEYLIPIIEFAQEAIFAVMGLEGEDRKKVCHHWGRYLCEEGEKKVWKCIFCDTEFAYEKE